MNTLSIGGDTQGTIGDTATIYINATGADGVGYIMLDVLYDPSIINASDVTVESLATDSVPEFDIDNELGDVMIVLTNPNGITGSGPLAKINYNVVGSGSSALDISVYEGDVLDIYDNDIFVNNTINSIFKVGNGGDISTYYRGLGQNPNILETSDLLKASDDWKNNVVPPGFSSSVTTGQLLVLADEWRNS